jgi:penicillin amidase
VPHVRASSESDLYRGLGWCHGRDRALQMLLVRILGQGRAAECLDDTDDALKIDRFFRRMNFGAGAEDAVGKLADEDRRLMQAYCDGVNEALRRRVPWELRVLRHRPAEWTPADCMLLQRLIGYIALAQSQGEMERLVVEMVQAGVPSPLLDELFPSALGDLDPELLRTVTLGERLVPEAVRWNVALPRAMASNNWVVAGSRTASGAALLSNDPHLEANRLPAMWCEAVLELGDRYCLAATMPGLPSALLGRTNDLAWGATYTFMDAIDSWVEDCRDGCYRRTEGGNTTWHRFRVRTEVIRRKRHPDVTLTFHENDHGVLDGDPMCAGRYLATRWASGSGTGAKSTAAVFGILHAGDVESGMALLGQVETAWNWVLADRHGNIGYQMSGTMPVRGRGNGLVPLPGWDPANDWKGIVPATDLPRTTNPDCGFLVTANNDLNHLGRVRPINLPMGSSRADRIAQLLAERDDWSPATTQAMHMDTVSRQAAAYMEPLRPLLPDTPAGSLLRDWDCGYDLESGGATLFELFYRALLLDVFGRTCGTDIVRHLLDETGIVVDFYANFDAVLLDADSGWYGEEGRDATWRRIAAAVVTAPPQAWGERQQVVMRHLLLGGRLPRWLGFDHGPIPIRGSRGTIHQGQVYRSGGRDTSFAPSFRLVTDFGEEAVHTGIAGGPSDRRFSRWYVSGVADWLAGRTKRLEPSRGDQRGK